MDHSLENSSRVVFEHLEEHTKFHIMRTHEYNNSKTSTNTKVYFGIV